MVDFNGYIFVLNSNFCFSFVMNYYSLTDLFLRSMVMIKVYSFIFYLSTVQRHCIIYFFIKEITSQIKIIEENMILLFI